MATICAIGAVVTTIIVSLLPARLRSVFPVVLVCSVTTATVAFGTQLARTLPRRIVATHAAADILAGLHRQIPQLGRLTAADPLVDYELSSAFHAAYLAGSGPAEARATQAGHSFGLAVQQAFLRELSRLSNHSAQRLIGLERQTVELLAEADPDACDIAPVGDGHGLDARGAEQLAGLRRAVLRAKVQALVELEQAPPLFGVAERFAFETRLLIEADRWKTGDGSCSRMIAFYAALQQQSPAMQGKWVRSRQIFPVDG